MAPCCQEKSLVHMDTQEYVVFIKLLEGAKADPIKLVNVASNWEALPKYTACAILSPDGSKSSSTAVSPDMESMFRELRSSTIPTFLWIEQLCIDQSNYNALVKYVPLLKRIYMAAERVVIWAGNDQEPTHDRCLDFYLDPDGVGVHRPAADTLHVQNSTQEESSNEGSMAGESVVGRTTVRQAAMDNAPVLEPMTRVPTRQEITAHAFKFASQLATADVSEVAKILRLRHPVSNIHSWAYLFRILCRPFFRELPLLRTNYLGQLPSATVLCSNSEIALSHFREAAARIWAIFPFPSFIQEKTFQSEVKATEDIRSADREFLLSCIRFGFHRSDVWGRLREVFRKDGDDGSVGTSQTITERCLAHVETCNDIYCLDKRPELFRTAMADSKAFMADPASYIAAALARQNMQPSLQYEDCKVSPPPLVSDQAPFIHFQAKRTDTILLIKLYPAITLSEPLQCCFVEPRMDEAPEFSFVTNSTVLRAQKRTKPYLGARFQSTTQHTALILVNKQAFVVPRLQEVFLRLVRDDEKPTYLFMWNICMEPTEAIQSKENMQGYFQIKTTLKVVSRAVERDMYDVLETAGSTKNIGQLEEVGLPKGMTWDEWLLQIND